MKLGPDYLSHAQNDIEGGNKPYAKPFGFAT